MAFGSMRTDAMFPLSGSHDGAHRMKKIAIIVMDALSLIAFFLFPANALWIAALIRQSHGHDASTGPGLLQLSIVIYDIIPGSVGAIWITYRYVTITKAKYPNISDAMRKIILFVVLMTILLLIVGLYSLIGRE